MRNFALWFLLACSLVPSAGCRGDDDDSSPAAAPELAASRRRPAIEQVSPPLDLRAPPADATRTASGLVYKTLVRSTGVQVRSDDTVLVRYTGWRQQSGETFFTARSREQSIAIDVAHAAPGFREALPLLHRGEKVMLWVPASPGTLEPVAYEVEIVDIVARPVAGGGAKPATESTTPPAAGKLPAAQRSSGQEVAEQGAHPRG